MSARDIFWSYDFGLATLVGALIVAFSPVAVPNAVAKEFYGAGISVLSIVFSVFFAALATIASSSDNDFVRFLDEDGAYSEIIAAFRVTLFLLFVALLTSLFAYGVTVLVLNQAPQSTQSRYFIAGFGFLFTWGMLATYNSAGDAIHYAAARVRYLHRTKGQDDL